MLAAVNNLLIPLKTRTIELSFKVSRLLYPKDQDKLIKISSTYVPSSVLGKQSQLKDTCTKTRFLSSQVPRKLPMLLVLPYLLPLFPYQTTLIVHSSYTETSSQFTSGNHIESSKFMILVEQASLGTMGFDKFWKNSLYPDASLIL